MDSNPADLSIKEARGVGPQRAKLFSRLGIATVRDALYYLPCRYEDRSNPVPISGLSEGFRTVRGAIISAATKRLRRGKAIFDITLNDGTGITGARWFNQAFLGRTLKVGLEVVLSGQVKRGACGGLVFEGPDYEVSSGDADDLIHTNRIVPVYRLTEGIGQKQLRKIMFGIVEDFAEAVADPVPSDIVRRRELPALAESLRAVHFPHKDMDPASFSEGGIYRRRLAFDELFFFTLGMALLKRLRGGEKGHVIRGSGDLRKRLRERLTFRLTGAQERVLQDIFRDMGAPHPMHRLIQGDVGSGKTLVGLMAMLNAVECGFQAALMAPTEILAEQHYLTLRVLLNGLDIGTGLLTGGAPCRPEDIRSGALQIVVGTHALIQEGVSFKNLGLAVVDEQHKFGVMQRLRLKKKGLNSHMLVMTATPIPRSLALTLYGDLDCSVIDELPPHRKPVKTRVFMEERKSEVYGILEHEIGQGRQAYVVYPAIEESDAGLKAAVQGCTALRRMFPAMQVGLLHGRMSTGEKESVMSEFAAGRMDILVSTTVIEVGVDVANATVMAVVHAERFGLSQLHQLRGRVGRGPSASHCLLIAYGPLGEDALRRLDIMVKSGDGFRIAEEDLAIRGPGEFFGARQAGLPDLGAADLVRDRDLLELARDEAARLMEKDPGLLSCPGLRNALEVFWRGNIELMRTG